MAIDEKIINRINELAKKKKTLGLSKKEQEEQAKLRKKYLEAFRKNMKSTLNNIDVVDKYELSTKKYVFGNIKELEKEEGIKKVSINNDKIEVLYDYKKITKQKLKDMIDKVK